MDETKSLLCDVIDNWIITVGEYLDDLINYSKTPPKDKPFCTPDIRDKERFDRNTNFIYQSIAATHIHIAKDVRKVYNNIKNCRYDLRSERQTINDAVYGLRSYQQTELLQDTRKTEKQDTPLQKPKETPKKNSLSGLANEIKQNPELLGKLKKIIAEPEKYKDWAEYENPESTSITIIKKRVKQTEQKEEQLNQIRESIKQCNILSNFANIIDSAIKYVEIDCPENFNNKQEKEGFFQKVKEVAIDKILDLDLNIDTEIITENSKQYLKKLRNNCKKKGTEDGQRRKKTIMEVIGQIKQNKNNTILKKYTEAINSISAKENTPGAEKGDSRDNWCNETFTEVRIKGKDYSFNKTQALVVKYLWNNISASEKEIGEYIDSASDNYRLISTFRDHKNGGYHPAWGTIIVKSDSGKGIFELKKS